MSLICGCRSGSCCCLLLLFYLDVFSSLLHPSMRVHYLQTSKNLPSAVRSGSVDHQRRREEWKRKQSIGMTFSETCSCAAFDTHKFRVKGNQRLALIMQSKLFFISKVAPNGLLPFSLPAS